MPRTKLYRAVVQFSDSAVINAEMVDVTVTVLSLLIAYCNTLWRLSKWR